VLQQIETIPGLRSIPKINEIPLFYASNWITLEESPWQQGAMSAVPA